MEIIHKIELTVAELTELCELWNNEYPANIKYHKIDKFIDFLNNLIDLKHYLIYDNNKIIAWTFVFIRNEERFFGIIIESKFQNLGIGTKLMNHIKSLFPILNGWVVDNNEYLKVDNSSYLSPLDFYLKNEFRVMKNIRLELESFSAVRIVWEK